jgi:hypothetical protein
MKKVISLKWCTVDSAHTTNCDLSKTKIKLLGHYLVGFNL